MSSPIDPAPDRDPLDGDWDDGAYWSTTNVGEAMPGVLTPLGWSIWGPACELGLRRAFHAVGALERSRALVPPRERDRLLGIFHGRVAVRTDFLAEMGDRLPGTDGAAVAEQFLGHVPDDLPRRPTRRRLPIVAARFPHSLATISRRVRATHVEVDRWWRAEFSAPPTDLDGALAQWKRAHRRFTGCVVLQAQATLVAVQPAYDQVIRLAQRTGHPDLATTLIAGLGEHAETAFVSDLWRLSRDETTLEDFLLDHGYHGPGEGELSSRVWREDPGPIRALVAQYRAKPDDAHPGLAHRRLVQRRLAAEEAVLHGLSPVDRARARAALTMARRFVPLRGVGKVSFLQSLDVARSAARRIGYLLVERRVLREPDDVFLLCADELVAAGSRTAGDFARLVAHRRDRRREHLALSLPGAWRGRPSPTPVADPNLRERSTIEAVGASPGVVEGRVRVVHDPGETELDDGDVLVAHTTDPSWASVMFLAGALVVDIGGTLSHAAVVARELGIPCVMGTGDGTRRLRTGDLVRVDGRAGTVEVLTAVP